MTHTHPCSYNPLLPPSPPHSLLHVNNALCCGCLLVLDVVLTDHSLVLVVPDALLMMAMVTMVIWWGWW